MVWSLRFILVGRVGKPNVYLQKLGKLCVTEILLSFVAEVQPDELTVPVEGNVVMHCGLAEDVTYILWKSEMRVSDNKRRGEKHPSHILITLVENLVGAEERLHLDC